MGFDLERFTTDVDDDLKCSVCLGVLENPLATPCGHVFCSNCALPWVVQNGCCPLKCEQFTTKELNNVLPLRNIILKLEIRCEFWQRGCEEKVKVQNMSCHSDDCDFAPVECSNKGCREIVNIKDQANHETVVCEFRPVGPCKNGCGLTLQHNTVSDHNCLKALQTHVSTQQVKLANMEHDMKKMVGRATKREKSLLSRIASMQNEVQMQALKFQKKLNEYKAEIDYLTKVMSFEKPCSEEKEITILLERDDGSLGFNIIGGNGAEGGLSEGIIVSRISEQGAAERAELKIHDRITKVNGQDLTKSSHEEAVEAFKNAKEPIVVHVLRRTSRVKGKDDKEPLHCNAGTQTDLQSEDLLWRVLQRCPTPPPAPSDVSLEGLCDLPSPEPLTSFDGELMNDLYAMDNLDMPIIDDSIEKTFEMEYEDVVLRRSNTTEKLGLTLCYGEEDDTGIFINEVDSNGVAAKDGSIRIGDQILQINGEDVLNKDQALSLFAEPAEELTLLVCRPQLQYDEFLFDDNNSLLEDLQLDMLERTHQEAMQFTACLLDAECQQDDDARTTDTGTTENTSTGNASTHKDSGVGHATDESIRNDSEQEGAGDELCVQYSGGIRNGELRCSTDSFMTNEHDVVHEISLSECLKFKEQLTYKCDKHMRSDTDSESLRGKESKVMRLGSDSMETTSVSGEDTLNRNGQWLGMAHDSQVSVISQEVQDNIWAKQDSSNTQSMESVDSAENIKDKLTTEPTAATGSGDEVDSKTEGQVELSLKLKTLQNGKADTAAHMSLVDKSLKKPLQSGRHRSRLPKTNPSSPRKSSSSSSRDRSSSKEKSTASPAKDKVKSSGQPKTGYHHQRMPATNPRLRAQLSQRTPYFARIQEQAQILHTKNSYLQKENIQLRRSLESLSSITSIPNYAKHYRSYMHLVKKNEEKAFSEDKDKDTKQDSQPEMKWKVKIRSDGTRYIARRPVRDKILKDRENKLQDERGGLTTDDEAMSEMKLGRYWNREDRKRHIERAKDQRRRREFMVQARMEALKEQGSEENKKQDIFDLSRKKMHKKKSRGGWDDFMTVEEMLAHGIRISPSNSKEFNPLLNVTTV